MICDKTVCTLFGENVVWNINVELYFCKRYKRNCECMMCVVNSKHCLVLTFDLFHVLQHIKFGNKIISSCTFNSFSMQMCREHWASYISLTFHRWQAYITVQWLNRFLLYCLQCKIYNFINCIKFFLH